MLEVLAILRSETNRWFFFAFLVLFFMCLLFDVIRLGVLTISITITAMVKSIHDVSHYVKPAPPSGENPPK